jgi:hypothetical protein
MDASTPSHDLDNGLPCGAANASKSGEKFISAKIPYNPLKGLDSDEEIQGNPIVINRDIRAKNATFQENPNGSPRPISQHVAAMEPNRLHPNAKRPSSQAH